MQVRTLTTRVSEPRSGEVAGVPEGPEMVLPSGVRIQLQRLDSRSVGVDHLRDAIRGVLKLPMSHQRLFATLDIPIELVPVINLEDLPGSVNPVVAATRVAGPDGAARPDRMRIAAYQAILGTEVQEAVQHEIGHALSVLTRQDLSEDAAEAYAARY